MTITHRSCIRGCVRARAHLADCDRDCRGCMPRDAEHGWLCYGCHKRLVNLLENAAMQADLLAETIGDKAGQDLHAVTTARIGSGWRTTTAAPAGTMHAKPRTAGHEASEPVRLACIDAADAIRDRLALWVVDLVNDYRLAGPAEYTIREHAAYVLRHIERIEARLTIGQEWGEWAEVMSQAHTLAPWREEVARLRGIACPECHAAALVRFGGDEHVTCLRCRTVIPPARYLIWTRILAAEATERDSAG